MRFFCLKRFSWLALALTGFNAFSAVYWEAEPTEWHYSVTNGIQVGVRVQESWFQLSARAVSPTNHGKLLISWSVEHFGPLGLFDDQGKSVPTVISNCWDMSIYPLVREENGILIKQSRGLDFLRWFFQAFGESIYCWV